MAMTKCKECGKDISTTALACPNCGATTSRTATMSKKKGSGCGPVAGIFLLIILGIGYCTDQKEKSDEQAKLNAMTPEQRAAALRVKAEEENERDAYYTCETFTKRNLRDPDSAQFMDDETGNPADRLAKPDGNGKYSKILKVRAANGFGGKTVSMFSCTVQLTGDKWYLVDLQEIPLN